jgi:hypothetical protein
MATRSVSDLDDETFKAYLLTFLLDARRRKINIKVTAKEVEEYAKANNLPTR